MAKDYKKDIKSMEMQAKKSNQNMIAGAKAV
jgi:hypothetical protein